MLTEAREAFEINHRTLSVLRALMTFLPDRHILAEQKSAIVFPSNKTLSTRLNGMPESTLRRHLAALVNAGIVSRANSTNGKRYARRVGGIIAVSYGFDLSPIARHITQLEAEAHSAKREREEIEVLRAQLIEIKYQLQSTDPHAAQELFKALRRKLRLSDLQDLLERFQHSVDTNEVSGPDRQNERHIDIKTNINSDSETQHKKNNDADLDIVLETCNEYKSYFPEPIKRWHQLISVADRIVPMIGIDQPVFNEAKDSMGAATAATVILCILERLTCIENPGAYLRTLAKKAKSGGFEIQPLLDALISTQDRQIVS